MDKPRQFYQSSYGVHLPYNKRMRFGCNQVKPRDKAPASKAWRCADCKAKAREARNG